MTPPAADVTDPVSPWASRPSVAARTGLLVCAALVPLLAGAGALLAGADGARGGLLGAIVPVVVLAITWAAAHLGRGLAPTAFALLLVGSYAVKLTATALYLRSVRDLAGVDATWLAVAAGIGLVCAVATEAVVVTRTRAPYVEP